MSRQSGASGLANRAQATATLLTAALLMTAGCVKPKPPAAAAVMTRQEVIQQYNQNVAAIPAFKARVANWKARFIDDKGKVQHYDDIAGQLFYRPAAGWQEPAQFYLRCSIPVIENEAFVVAGNEREYWIYSKLAHQGSWDNYGEAGQSSREDVFINPLVFLDFAALRVLPSQPPYPAYKFDAQYHTLLYITYADDGYKITREIIIDRRDNLPRQIRTYDQNGQVILESKLGNYQKLAGAQLPGEISISYGQEDFSLRLKLKDFRVDDKKRMGLFTRPISINGIEDYRQITAKENND